MGVAEAAVAAMRQHDAPAGLDQIGDYAFLVLGQDLGPDRNLDHEIGAGCPGSVLAHAVVAALGLEVLAVAKVDEGVEVCDRLGDHAAAAAAIATVGAADLNELLGPEGDDAGAAVSRVHMDFGFVKKLHGRWPSGSSVLMFRKTKGGGLAKTSPLNACRVWFLGP